MSAILDILTRIKKPSPPPLQPGLYDYRFETTGERSHVHLRCEPDDSGVLMVNASRVFHLNQSATFMAHLALQNTPVSQAVYHLKNKYKIQHQRVEDDYAQFVNQLTELIRPDGVCPIHELDLDVNPPFHKVPSAPYRMDLALTYRCNNDCAHCYNARPRQYPELSIQEWYSVLDRVWEIGIPHVVFTGGEPTLFQGLPDLIRYAEHKGFITGLNSNARRLSDDNFLNKLLASGLDHVQITVESHDPEIHDRLVQSNAAWVQTIAGLQNALKTPLYVMTNTTLLKQNSLYLEQTLEYLASLGVPTIGLNALIYSGHGKTVGSGLNEMELAPLLALARERTEKSGQRLIWYTPTQYCNFDPMQLDLGVKGCTAALYNMCIEPDGGVIPCQSYYHKLGNLLTDPWDSIWKHPLSINLRERCYIHDECKGCTFLQECGGGCPLTMELGDDFIPSQINLFKEV